MGWKAKDFLMLGLLGVGALVVYKLLKGEWKMPEQVALAPEFYGGMPLPSYVTWGYPAPPAPKIPSPGLPTFGENLVELVRAGVPSGVAVAAARGYPTTEAEKRYFYGP